MESEATCNYTVSLFEIDLYFIIYLYLIYTYIHSEYINMYNIHSKITQGNVYVPV